MSPVSNTNGSPMTMSPTPILKNGMMSNGHQQQQQQQQQHVQFRTDQALQHQQQHQQQSTPIPVNIINTNRKHCHY